MTNTTWLRDTSSWTSCAGGAFLLLVSSLNAATPNGIAQGKSLYQAQCAPCHGMTGEGGYGPTLNRVRLLHAPDHATLFRVVKGGIPGTNMPGFGLLPDAEIEEVAQYVRTLGTVEKTALPGDARNGELVFESKGGCTGCHIVEGRGNGFGPELTEVGARRNVAYLRTKLLDPGTSIAENYWTVQVVKRNGETLNGLWVNEDSFTLQLRDASGRIHSFRKGDLKESKRLDHTSLMPSYSQTLTKSEIEDVVSYLAERGAQ